MELGEVVEVVETARRAVEIPADLRAEDAEQVDDVDVDAPTA